MRFGINDELKSFPSFQDAAVTILTSFFLYIFMLLPPEGRKDAAWEPANKVMLHLPPPPAIQNSLALLSCSSIYSLSPSRQHTTKHNHISRTRQKKLREVFVTKKKYR